MTSASHLNTQRGAAAEPPAGAGSPSPKSDSPQQAVETGRQPSGRSPLSRLTGVQVLGLGAHAPEQVVRNEDLAPLGYDSDWIVQRTGIRERRRAGQETACSDLAIEAARRCLASSQVGPDEIDLILVATMTPDHPTPSTACLVQAALGCRCPAMDVNAACAGFMYALATGMQFVASGCCRHVLVIGADIMSRTVNPADVKTFPLFGDGAGAALLAAGTAAQGFDAFTLGAEGAEGQVLQIPAGGSREPLTAEGLACGRQFLAMDGRQVFKWAVRLLSDTVQDVLDHAGVVPGELDLVVLHQANIRIIDAAVSELGLPRERVVTNLDRYGNTSAASIPLALEEAAQKATLQRGSRLLLCGFGAGLAWGAGVMTW